MPREFERFGILVGGLRVAGPTPLMRARQGFTLIEAMIVVAILGILAATAFAVSQKALRQGRLHGSVHELALQATSLRMLAMRDGVDYALIIADAPGDPRSCSVFAPANCATYTVLKNVPVGWDPTGFNPQKPGALTNALTGPFFSAQYNMDTGVGLTSLAASTCPPPQPFPQTSAAIRMAAPGGIYAIRFSASGRVSRILPPAQLPAVAPDVAGFSMSWGTASNAATPDAAGGVTGVVIGYPSGLVRIFRGC